MEPIREIVQRAPPASGEQIFGQEIPSQSRVPGSVCSEEPQLHGRSTGAVFGSHTTSYQYWVITQRNNSAIQTGLSKGEPQAVVTPAATETLSGVRCLSSQISKDTFVITDDHYRLSM